VALLLATAGVGAPGAKTYLSREQALAQVFGSDAKVESHSVFLSADAVKRAEAAAGAKLASARVTAYVGRRGDELIGTAYLDTHPVRSMNETVLIVVSPARRVAAVEVLAFNEPEDYLPPRRWLDTFEDKTLTRDLKPGAAVPHLGGATLTARAVAAAVRRTLALHVEVETALGATATMGGR
jgi:hypothetical protein